MKLPELHNINQSILLYLSFSTWHSLFSWIWQSRCFSFSDEYPGLTMPFLCENMGLTVFQSIFHLKSLKTNQLYSLVFLKENV